MRRTRGGRVNRGEAAGQKPTRPVCGPTNKMAFRSEGQAAEYATENGWIGQRAYLCFGCGGWHLTTQKFDPKRRAISAATTQEGTP